MSRNYMGWERNMRRGSQLTIEYKLYGMRDKSGDNDQSKIELGGMSDQSKIELGGMRDKSHKRDNK